MCFIAYPMLLSLITITIITITIITTTMITTTIMFDWANIIAYPILFSLDNKDSKQ